MIQGTNKLILGTVQFGLKYGINNKDGKPDTKEVTHILDTAYENNIRLLDTAEAYGDAQEVIGNYHRTSKNKFEVITKLNSVRNSRFVSVKEQVLKDLEILNVDYLYGYMFHSFNDFENHYEKYKNDIRELKGTGHIRKFGVSLHSNAEIEKLSAYKEIDLVQVPFNLLDNVQQRSVSFASLKSKGIEIHTRSAFLQGLIFKDPRELPEKLIPLSRYLAQIRSFSTKNNLDLNDLALNYVIQQDTVDRVLIGVDTATQLIKNISALESKLTVDTLTQINSIMVKETELLNPANWN